jgi:tRNA threonylcarbamoyladenosine biosynthesis protein TsaB
MKILALEFSSTQRSVAVLSPNRGSATAPTAAVEVVEGGTRMTRAFGMIEEALRLAEVEREQIELLAVGLGPGSYNGIRVAIAIAQGWQLAREVRVLGIGSVECIAAQAQADGLFGEVAIVVDAQRGEFYLAVYSLTIGERREVQPLRIVSPDQVNEALRAGRALVGPELTNHFPLLRQVVPRAAMLANLASQRADFTSADKLTPIYLRETAFVKAPAPLPLAMQALKVKPSAP